MAASDEIARDPKQETESERPVPRRRTRIETRITSLIAPKKSPVRAAVGQTGTAAPRAPVEKTTRPASPGVAPAATQMGRHVAKLLKEEKRLEQGRFADRKHELRPRFRYLDKGIMAIIGKNFAVVKSGGMKLRGLPAWFAWLFIHIAFLIGFRNRLAVLLGWAFAYLRDNPQARIIVHPQGGPPR